LGMASSAMADTFRVPQDFETIQEAVDAADGDDTILVSKGVYTETVTVTGKDNLKFIGKGAIWDGGDDGTQLLINGENVLVQGFTFRNGNVQVAIYGDGAVVQKCKSKGASDMFLFIRGPVGNDDVADGARVVSCQVISSMGTGVRMHADDSVVSKCKFDHVNTNAIFIFGDRALVEKCQIKRSYVTAIRVGGNDAVVQSNKITWCRIKAIMVGGGNPRILKNKVTGGCEAVGVDLQHGEFQVREAGPFLDGGLIEGNSVSSVAGAGVRSNWGSVVTIRGNKMKNGGGDGIACSTNDAIIDGNSVQGFRERGLVIFADGVEARSISIKKGGGGCDAAVTVEGSDNLLENISVVDWGGDGFQVSGDSNELMDCLASKCTMDGFDIETASGAPVATENTVLDNCTATNCGGEGLDNSGSNTDVMGSTFLKNLLDVVNDGSFGTLDANFQSGGDSTDPQFECTDFTHRTDRTTIDGVLSQRYFDRPDRGEMTYSTWEANPVNNPVEPD
ncbi:MAG: right-handed parallel beta-helix repeat-containing protein, partial [Planctomycetota bacterium]